MRKRGQLIHRCRLSVEKQRTLLKFFANGVSGCATARATRVDKKTALRIFRIFRNAILWHRRAISPFTGTVQADECYLHGAPRKNPYGKKFRFRGRSLDGKFCIAGIAQRDPQTGTRRVRLSAIDSINSETLCGFIAENVSRGSTVHTDQLPAYNALPDHGFTHHTVCHQREWKNKTTGACTNLIESVWSQLKRHLARFNGGWRYHLTHWLAETEMRYECGVDSFLKKLSATLRAYRKTLIHTSQTV